jgi:hypothetical protein
MALSRRFDIYGANSYQRIKDLSLNFEKNILSGLLLSITLP